MTDAELVSAMIRIILDAVLGLAAILTLFGIYIHMFRNKRNP